MDLSPDLARKLLTRDFANLAQRVQRGGNLSRTERAMLQGMAASSGPAQATVAENYVELAGILGVTQILPIRAPSRDQSDEWECLTKGCLAHRACSLDSADSHRLELG